jgi:hypothetical protein
MNKFLKRMGLSFMLLTGISNLVSAKTGGSDTLKSDHDHRTISIPKHMTGSKTYLATLTDAEKKKLGINTTTSVAPKKNNVAPANKKAVITPAKPVDPKLVVASRNRKLQKLIVEYQKLLSSPVVVLRDSTIKKDKHIVDNDEVAETENTTITTLDQKIVDLKSNIATNKDLHDHHIDVAQYQVEQNERLAEPDDKVDLSDYLKTVEEKIQALKEKQELGRTSAKDIKAEIKELNREIKEVKVSIAEVKKNQPVYIVEKAFEEGENRIDMDNVHTKDKLTDTISHETPAVIDTPETKPSAPEKVKKKKVENPMTITGAAGVISSLDQKDNQHGRMNAEESLTIEMPGFFNKLVRPVISARVQQGHYVADPKNDIEFNPNGNPIYDFRAGLEFDKTFVLSNHFGLKTDLGFGVGGKANEKNYTMMPSLGLTTEKEKILYGFGMASADLVYSLGKNPNKGVKILLGMDYLYRNMSPSFVSTNSAGAQKAQDGGKNFAGGHLGLALSF